MKMKIAFLLLVLIWLDGYTEAAALIPNNRHDGVGNRKKMVVYMSTDDKKSGFDFDQVMNRMKGGFDLSSIGGKSDSFAKTYSLSPKQRSSSPSTSAKVKPEEVYNVKNDSDVKASEDGIDFSMITDRMKDLDVSVFSKSLISVKENVLKGEFGSRGEIYFALQAGILLFVLIGNIPVIGDTILTILGPALVVSGVIFLVTGGLELGSSLSPWPVPVDSKDSKLIKSGPYQYVRHPLYAGLIAACTGIGIITDSAARLLLTALLVYVLNLKSEFEEQELINKFGSDYINYQTEVTGKFFPNDLLDLLPWTTKDE